MVVLLLCIPVDRSFVRLMLRAWPLLSLNKAQLNAAYLRQNIVETAGIQFNLLVDVHCGSSPSVFSRYTE